MQKSGCWFYTSWRHLQKTEGKHMVVDNSEVLYKVGTAIELCGKIPNSNLICYLSCFYLSCPMSHMGFISMATMPWDFSITHQHLSIVLLGLMSIEWLKTWVIWSQIQGPGPCSDHWECLSCTYRPLLFLFRRVEPSLCSVLQFQCLLI